MKAEVHDGHRWLHKLLGDWDYEGEADAGPGKPPEKFRGSEHVRAIGDIWIQGESRGEMPDGASATMVITLGYDPQRQRYVGTWIGSMMSYLWIYDGGLDAAGRILTLDAEGPSFASEGKIAKYQDIIEIVSDDHRTLSSRSLGEDGQWRRFMTAHYRRKK